MKHEWEYMKGILVDNVNHLIHKIDKGYFNIILIFGATRSGKSTIAMQIADHMAKNLNVPFNESFIYFDAVALEKECAGKKRQVFILDEAAFDLTGEDWAKDAQKRLKTYFSVAAKFNQTFILIIPHIEELRKYFVINEHTKGLEVTFNHKTLERGYAKLYSRAELRAIYYLRKMNHYGRAATIFGYKNRFSKATPTSVDMDSYNKRKDEAINTQGEADAQNTKAAYILKGLELGLDPKTVATMLNTTRQYVYTVRNNRLPPEY